MIWPASRERHVFLEDLIQARRLEVLSFSSFFDTESRDHISDKYSSCNVGFEGRLNRERLIDEEGNVLDVMHSKESIIPGK